MINLLVNNLLTIPMLAFFLGIVFSIARFTTFSNDRIASLLTQFLLFAIGLKGGCALAGCATNTQLPLIFGILILWGLVQPLFAYAVLRKVTKLDQATQVTIAACFGSVSVMTYVAGANFLDRMEVPYDALVVTALAIMEVPAIISGLFIYKFFNNSYHYSKKKLLLDVLCNKTIFLIFFGIGTGLLCSTFNWHSIPAKILLVFKPFLCLFLFNMGYLVGKHRNTLKQFSLPLSLFGIYMPLLGGGFGIFLSSLFHLDVGTGTLIAVLTASASYIAVPAAMRMALPEAKEAIYLPLSIGITFPFNVMVGIPLYYNAALRFL